ncbi:MAG: TIGR03905 family TSCPD domain-containing protein [Muribaculaceae bacterium]|nr:TIGR03905 family TSCPD domain-containing protein [Muribaculaceae bacterium]
MKYTYIPQGVCSKQMEIEIEDGVITNVSVQGGCNGNLKGICSLVRGMDATEVRNRLTGIQCGTKTTSCPDQLAQAIDSILSR